MFKLIFGLGNSDIKNIEALAKLYAQAGAWMFDVSPFMLPVLHNALIGSSFNPDDFKYCVSVPVEGDVHGKKAKILTQKCKKCLKCQKACPQGAICNLIVDEKKCIGCGICKKKCSHGAIKLYDKTDYFKELKKLIKNNEKIDCIELHSSVANRKEVLKLLSKITKRYKGAISLCISRKNYSTDEAFKLINQAKEILKDNSDFFVQADGKSMNGGSCDFSSSLESVAFALALKDLGIDEKKIILSGGINAHTKDLCAKFSISPLALAFGTYARKSVQDKNPDEAFKIASELVKNACEACGE